LRGEAAIESANSEKQRKLPCLFSAAVSGAASACGFYVTVRKSTSFKPAAFSFCKD
jgi:hypothetical protein